ncbi:DJ-1/PfpI family protein [Gallibacterium salpingitidis]|uniref:DJ-1 family glyoxalase III n=1 Tax=Gallibacterium salpingitidis TaxID=505341 RepID=UPI0026702133|nr:DJ-1 family glyoxalase III [Gallibacterium salpingitidis]WKS99933.1 DJ-1/PfpI family protein [Gallibacterium salpingitidis]
MSQKIAVLLTTGFEDAEALVPIDLFRRVELDVDLISIEDSEIVSSAHQIKVIADKQIKQVDLSQYDMIMLPGGNIDLNKYIALSEIYQQFLNNNKRIAAICAAPTVLAKLGLLTNKNAVCYPAMRDNFAENNVIYHHVPAVVDSAFITGRGPGAAFDFALTVISELLGVETAEKLKQQLYY